MTQKVNDKTNEEEICLLKMKMTEALRNKDVSSVISLFAQKSVMFVLAPPLRYIEGVNAPGENGVEDWFNSFDGPLGYEFRELEIVSSNDIAFCHSIDHISGKRSDGTHTDVWIRETLGLRKVGSEWRIVHQHQSVPMYMDGSNKAAIDLKP